MSRIFVLLLAAQALGIGWMTASHAAVTLPISSSGDSVQWNPATLRGVPVSGTVGVPEGSDGRLPSGLTLSGSFNEPTAGQYQSFVVFGGGAAAADWRTLSTSTLLNGVVPYSGAVARAMQLPMALDGTNTVLTVRQAALGTPYFARASSLSFGSVIPVPAVDESRKLLEVVKEDYWLPEPYSTNNHQNVGYYWSPHARQVFAIQAGPVSVTWRKNQSYTAATLPSSYVNPGGGPSFETNGSSIFLLYTEKSTVSGSAVKAPRTMYWTEKEFRALGKPVSIPPARIGAVNIVYGAGFPKNVASEYKGPGYTSPTDGSTNAVLQELRTLWYDQSQGFMLAYNQEGRVFVELLGDFNADGRTRVPLGFEIVDVVKQPTPQDLDCDLGERLMAPAAELTESLTPEEINQSGGQSFSFRHLKPGKEIPLLYAVRATVGANDCLVHWSEQGLQGVMWPKMLGRYRIAWPVDESRYSHYIRPVVSTEDEAMATAVRIDPQNVPMIAYQDPLDRPRAKLTPDSRFYTHLDGAYPLHRTLLRYQIGDKIGFERVFSWLESTVRDGSFAGTMATNLLGIANHLSYPERYAAYTNLLAEAENQYQSGLVLRQNYLVSSNQYVIDLATYNDYLKNPGNYANPVVLPTPPQWVDDPKKPVIDAPTGSTLWTDVLKAPRIVTGTVQVGDRLSPPSEEPGGSGEYLAGYIQVAQGNAYNPRAYVDPLKAGFAAAGAGAIIPVNADPSNNLLEVWWLRPSPSGAGLNAGNKAEGFATIYWPAYIGRYTIQWPSAPKEIVLASKLGSGTLDPFQTTGVIYAQNQKDQPGYNPNEEHAVMSGGMAFATRDDLNIVSGSNYSSAPYVLLDYRGSDGRPAMTAFKVLREKPEAGYVFDYVVPAGQMLQPPPPLTFLQKPVIGTGMYATNYNVEVAHEGADYPGGWYPDATSTPYGHYRSFTWADRKKNLWVYRAAHAGIPALEAGRYDPDAGTFGPLDEAKAVVGSDFAFTVHASRQSQDLTLVVNGTIPGWMRISGLTLVGRPESADVGSRSLELVVVDTHDDSRVTNSLALTVLDSGLVVGQDAIRIASSNSYTATVVNFVGRPPYLAESPTSTNSFTMRYYYKTEAGFDWPGVTNPPAVGTIVPYLRPIDPATGSYVGAPDAKETASLEIVYRPVWPVSDPKDSTKPLPTLPFGATLAMPAYNLPGVRDMRTVRMLYQQSIAQDIWNPNASAVLHDATREKYSPLDAHDLESVPSSVRTELYRGRYYFPALPPHLSKRVYFDPNRGAKGALVLKGEFVRASLGQDYTLLNVLRGSDLQAVLDLCPESDSTYKKSWDELVSSLGTDLETFVENPKVPGTYIPDPDQTVTIGVDELAEVQNDETPVDSYALSATGPGSGYVTLIEANGYSRTKEGDPVAMHVFKVGGTLNTGETKVLVADNPLSELVTFQHTADLAGRFDEFEYEWKIGAPVDGMPPIPDATMSRYLSLDGGTNKPRVTIGGTGIQALTDNYVVMRYRPVNPDHPLYNQWSEWTDPKLAEGWIKRVLAGINPFGQRLTDLFNNVVNTDVSMLTQAGRRWEGDVALNMETINNYGLVEIYETVLRRGRSLSIESGYNYGPANDALLLAAGYLHDLYMMIGNEAWADAANPTIGMGTKDKIYGDTATALFAFKGQMANLGDEELALLRGRDDTMMPGVRIAPVYNRLVWNYTRGIDSGEVVYALNYNIKEDPNRTPDGIINAADAAVMYPQGHGDAYGHYLTAIKGYYSLLMNSNFDWVPRIEAVNVLGQPVSVDYMDERKFAAAAAAIARTGQQVVDLTWRKSYLPKPQSWAEFGATRTNQQQTFTTASGTEPVVRYWGLDHWASRVAGGGWVNWVIGNALLQPQDPVRTHEGIQKVDRTTVPELSELASTLVSLQASLDNAEGGVSPLGIPEGGLVFDLDPNAVVGGANGTHFEQVYQRAKVALNNAVVSFDDAKDVTRLMRTEEDSLDEVRAAVAKQELAYRNALIELYGTPYTDDIGPGKTWAQGYEGPDLIHYTYIDIVESDFGGKVDLNESMEIFVSTQSIPEGYMAKVAAWDGANERGLSWLNGDGFTFNYGPHGFFQKPETWTGRRASPGKIQQAISDIVTAHGKVQTALRDAEGARQEMESAVAMFKSAQGVGDKIRGINRDLNIADDVLMYALGLNEVLDNINDTVQEAAKEAAKAAKEGVPTSVIAGVAAGGDATSPVRAALLAIGEGIVAGLDATANVRFAVAKAFESATETAKRWKEFEIAGLERDEETKNALVELGWTIDALEDHWFRINAALRQEDDALRAYRALVAQGDRIQEERMVTRQRSAQVIQGYRTRDAAFRLFRNEKLERYKTMFDLSARYALLAANAYDYETGLLGTSQGRDFKKRIIASRALGVVRNGEPQFAGSDTGDPGLSSTLAEMKADWDVLRGRLGFNNPDAYGTTVSLRTEALRILPTSDGDSTWKDALQAARSRNILEDPDVRRHCMQIDDGSGLPVPGIVLTFGTTIARGRNLFGRELAAGDHSFSQTAFATKIFGVGAALVGYRGMDDPSSNGGVVGGAGGTSPGDPGSWFLDSLALAANPEIYLIPVGVDSMRSPPLGDTTEIRNWSVEDAAIPMPFNIGGSGFSGHALWQSSDSLTEPMYTVRKHQAFRPVSNPALFSPSLYTGSGSLLRSQFMNNRLVGRSVWNSQWKLVIPGHTLLSNPNEGLDRLIQTLTDVKLHFVTYSYSGN